MSPRSAASASAIARLIVSCTLGSGVTACSGTLDAGSDRTQALLPVGAENPIILCNDGAYDNWQGEYAVLLAQKRAPELTGLVVSTGGMWYDLEANFSGWQELVASARASGLTGLPDPIRSVGDSLVRPDDDTVESTTPNDSEGARFIVETSSRLSQPDRPTVVVTGGRLTDVADAYLIDPTVAERIVVVASLGTVSLGAEPVAHMGIPNGEMDPWADAIVAERLRYVQVSAYYDQLTDVPDDRLGALPDNPLGAWMRAKQPDIFGTPLASDQIGVLAVGIPSFTVGVMRFSFSGWDGTEPLLVPDAGGNVWVVTESNGEAATGRFWQLLMDSATLP